MLSRTPRAKASATLCICPKNKAKRNSQAVLDRGANSLAGECCEYLPEVMYGVSEGSRVSITKTRA